MTYRYEGIAASLPLMSTVRDPKEGDLAKTRTGAIVVYRGGRWVYR